MWNTSAMDLDEWFKQIRQRYASQMQCGKGCTACCYGLFDISLADALEVAQGFGELATPLQERIAFGNTFPSSQRRDGCAERSEGADGVVSSATCFCQSD